MGAFAKPTLVQKMFCEEALAHDIFVMEAVIILALIEATKDRNAFAKRTLAQDRFVNKQLHMINLI